MPRTDYQGYLNLLLRRACSLEELSKSAICIMAYLSSSGLSKMIPMKV